jgi:hypothetical protein
MKNKQLVNFLFEQMYRLKRNEISIEEARTYSQLATQINNAKRNQLQQKLKNKKS